MGSIDVFNLQSGQHRQSLPARDLKSRRTGELGLASGSQEKKIGHTKAVTGLVVDSLNRTAISCGLDGKVKVRYTTPHHKSQLLSCINLVLGFSFRVTPR